MKAKLCRKYKKLRSKKDALELTRMAIGAALLIVGIL